jgi:FkbM family methyltransferase
MHRLVPANPIKIVDIGASDSSSHPYKSLMDRLPTHVIGFEPNEEECKKLKENYGTSHSFLPYFIGDGRPATFFETNFVATGSIFEPNMKLLQQFNALVEVTRLVARHPIQTHRLDDVLGDDANDVDFIKIDAQGSEERVFQHAPRTLAAATVIHTEVCFAELYKNQALFADVDRVLRAAGYRFHTFVGFGGRAYAPVVVNNDPMRHVRQYLWADAVYVRDPLTIDDLETDKLRRMAQLLFDMYQSVDLVHLLVARIDRRDGTNFASTFMGQQPAA